MSRPTHAACRASLVPMGWASRVSRPKTIAAVYDHSTSCAPLPAVVKPVTSIYALTTGPASHIGDDLACLIAQNLSLYLR
jgi:hypothetical protein